MKYFTPELVNSMCDKTMTDEQWDAACDGYDANLRQIDVRLPVPCQKFLEQGCVHQAMMVNISLDQEAGTLFMSCHDRAENKLCNLYYVLDGEANSKNHTGSGFGTSDESVCLYDEWDIDESGKYVHRILFENGNEMEILFREFHWTMAKVELDF